MIWITHRQSLLHTYLIRTRCNCWVKRCLRYLRVLVSHVKLRNNFLEVLNIVVHRHMRHAHEFFYLHIFVFTRYFPLIHKFKNSIRHVHESNGCWYFGETGYASWWWFSRRTSCHATGQWLVYKYVCTLPYLCLTIKVCILWWSVSLMTYFNVEKLNVANTNQNFNFSLIDSVWVQIFQNEISPNLMSIAW